MLSPRFYLFFFIPTPSGVVLSHTLLLFFYPIHPVYFTLSLSPLLNFLLKHVLLGRGSVKVIRNSTYKVGWKEWGTNLRNIFLAYDSHRLPDHSSPMECIIPYSLANIIAI